MLLKIHPDNPAGHKIKTAVDLLKKEGVLIIPTDSVYALSCSLQSKKAFDEICRIKGMRTRDASFTLLFSDLSHLSYYSKQFSKNVFRLINKNIPGPFTFVLEAAGNLPPVFSQTRKTIGFRVPENKICKELVVSLGYPLVTTSLKNDIDEAEEYFQDPETIHEHYHKRVDAVIDGGWGHHTPSTIVDLTGPEPVILRQGLGEFLS